MSLHESLNSLELEHDLDNEHSRTQAEFKEVPSEPTLLESSQGTVDGGSKPQFDDKLDEKCESSLNKQDNSSTNDDDIDDTNIPVSTSEKESMSQEVSPRIYFEIDEKNHTPVIDMENLVIPSKLLLNKSNDKESNEDLASVSASARKSCETDAPSLTASEPKDEVEVKDLSSSPKNEIKNEGSKDDSTHSSDNENNKKDENIDSHSSLTNEQKIEDSMANSFDCKKGVNELEETHDSAGNLSENDKHCELASTKEFERTELETASLHNSEETVKDCENNVPLPCETDTKREVPEAIEPLITTKDTKGTGWDDKLIEEWKESEEKTRTGSDEITLPNTSLEKQSKNSDDYLLDTLISQILIDANSVDQSAGKTEGEVVTTAKYSSLHNNQNSCQSRSQKSDIEPKECTDLAECSEISVGQINKEENSKENEELDVDSDQRLVQANPIVNIKKESHRTKPENVDNKRRKSNDGEVSSKSKNSIDTGSSERNLKLKNNATDIAATSSKRVSNVSKSKTTTVNSKYKQNKSGFGENLNINKYQGNDSGVDENTQAKVEARKPPVREKRFSSQVRQARSVDPTSKRTTVSASIERKVPMNRIEVGKAASPNIKNVGSKIGSLNNATHKAGGGNIRIESRKIDFSKSAASRIAAKNESYVPGGGEKKIEVKKLNWNVKSKIGSLDNKEHKPGGGDKKVETRKLDFKEKAQSKIGSKDNLKHKPKGGDVEITTEKLSFKEKASSKVGSLDNVKHCPKGGTKKIFDDKEYLRQRQSSSCASHTSRTSSGRTSGAVSPTTTGTNSPGPQEE